jgi:fatty acid desaturase
MQTNNISRKELLLLFGKKSSLKASIAIALNWAIFLALLYLSGNVVTMLPAPWSWIVLIGVTFFAGCALRGFDNLTHEASHSNIFSSKKKHLYLQFLYAFPVMKTLQDYWPSHKKHHNNYRNKKDDDPDTQQNIRWGVEYLPTNKTAKQVIWFYVARFLGQYYTQDNIKYNFWHHLKSRYCVPGRLAFWAAVLAIVALTHTWQYFLFGYAIPYLIWLPYIRFVTESSKHTNVNLQDDFANSRNNIGLFHQLILHPHNDGFHQMHHYAACIPFYNLKKAYRYLKADPDVRHRVIESFTPFQTIKQIFKRK